MSGFWERESAAERYSAFRPRFHPFVIGRIKSRVGASFGRALDAACGAGLSTVPLLEISDEVYGVDASPGMLAVASSRDGVVYVEAPVEDLPFDNDFFDILTVSSGLHWFDRETFLAEARRVLRPGGHLVAYDNHFTGRMAENPEYEAWLREVWMRGFPSPPRNGEPLSGAELSRHGFELVGEEDYEVEFRYSVEDLSEYLMTQSNAIAAVESGRIGEDELRRWLVEEQSPFFRGSTGTFVFAGDISFVRERRV